MNKSALAFAFALSFAAGCNERAPLCENSNAENSALSQSKL